MLTVIIYKKSSQEFIDRYRPLFEPYLESNEIAFCFWEEHGTDIQSAVPELSSIVRGAECWKAIVVNPLTAEDSNPDTATELICRENPFDFQCNSDPNPEVHESSIPLIRLAQMLGGVPLVNRHYTHTMESYGYKNGTGFKISRKETDESLKQQQSVWEQLTNKYSFNCEKPSRLYLFSARNMSGIQLPKDTDEEIQNRHESDSSMFWYRNRYPAKARFLTLDCSVPGHAHYNRDLFTFWMTVLTLALNEEPAGTFEAYKLYHVKSIVEKNILHTLFSDYYNRLNGAQFAANNQIIELQKEKQFNPEIDELPLYERTIPVDFKLVEEDDVFVSSKKIGFAGDCPIKEEPWWYHAVEMSIAAVTRLYRSIRRVLDRASLQCRYSSEVIEEEIYELDEYQYQDMDDKLSELEQDILTFSTYRILPMNKFYKDMDTAKKEAGLSMKKRMTRNMTIKVGIFTMLVYLIGFLPDIVIQMQMGEKAGWVFLFSLLGLPVIVIISMACLFYFRQIIRNKIDNYNRIISRFLAAMREAGQSFSGYLSKCCSYMRGRRMLQILDSRDMISRDSIIVYSKHVEHLEDQLNIIKNWIMDFDLDILPDKIGIYSRSDFDFEIPPEKNREYLIQLEKYNLDILADDGSTYKAPYPFVTGFTTKRVPLYEKIKNVNSDVNENRDRKGNRNNV